jgi:Ca-activated chloride channel family protein
MRQTVFATEYHSVKDTVGQGYFALSVYPNTLIQAEDIFNRNVVFLIDISRSMSGYKLEQSCQAITACLSTLNDQDRFALVTFDSYAQIRMAPVAATAANCLAATARLDTMAGLYGASTSNLVSGLTAALQTFSTNVYNNAVMVFTDGFSPCTPQQITNIHNVGIFPVGLGADVSRARLDAIAYANNGYATYFKETDPICNGIIEVFGRISNPVVKGLSFNWAAHGFTDLLPAAAPVALYNGSGFFLTGRYVAGGEYQLILSGSRTSGPLSLAFDLQFSTATDSGKNDFVRRMWAAEKILALERTIEVYGKQDSLRAQVVQLSLAHKIKSSLTSYWCDTLHVSEEHDGDDLLPTAVSVPMPVPANILHEIRISPQPVTSIFTLELPANQKHLAITHVMLVDLAGHVVARIQPVLLTDGKYRLVLYGNDTMHGGIYFLRFCLNGQPQALRIMVAKN